jgi:hypothetical protein
VESVKIDFGSTIRANIGKPARCQEEGNSMASRFPESLYEFIPRVSVLPGGRTQADIQKTASSAATNPGIVCRDLLKVTT